MVTPFSICYIDAISMPKVYPNVKFVFKALQDGKLSKNRPLFRMPVLEPKLFTL
jgi:hypothetical protein